MKKKLIYYTEKSKIMDIHVRYGEDVFDFNLTEELKVIEEGINEEAKQHPTTYGFLNMLYKRMSIRAKDLEKKAENTYNRLFIKYKTSIDENTNKPYPNEMAKAKALTHLKYIKAYENYSKVKASVEILQAAVESFTARKDIIQTLSANLRKEN